MTDKLFEFGDEEFQVLAEWLTRRGKGIFDTQDCAGSARHLSVLAAAPGDRVLLPGLDGTGILFEPLREALGSSIETIVVRYPADQRCDHSQAGGGDARGCDGPHMLQQTRAAAAAEQIRGFIEEAYAQGTVG